MYEKKETDEYDASVSRIKKKKSERLQRGRRAPHFK